MPNITIKPVTTSGEKKQFLGLPWKIYKGDPNWIPPLRLDQKEMVNYKHHPFYDTNEIQTFLAFKNGEPVGRIAAILNNGHNERFQEKRGFWGFFESIDNQEVASGLFAAVRDWFGQRGITALRGPTNPSLNYTVGLLIDSFDKAPTFMMTYNPPYYPKLVEAAGFTKCQDAYAYWGYWDMLGKLDKKLDFIKNEAIKRFNVKTRRLDKRRFFEEVKMFLDIYNRSLVATWGFVPLSDAELEHMAASMKHLVAPELTSIAEIDGKPVGAIFGLLDYNPRIKAIDGRLFPFGFMRLLWNKRAIKKIRLVSTNVLPEWQAWGLALVMLDRFVPDCREWGMQEGEFSWVLESNHLSRKSLERGGAILQRTYRIYDSV